MGPPRNVSFTRAELKSFTGATLPDLIAEGVRLLFAGINPGLRSVAVQGHFAPRGNRFYPALLRAGITDHLIDASAGLSASDRDYLLGRGVGITSLVARATASAFSRAFPSRVSSVSSRRRAGFTASRWSLVRQVGVRQRSITSTQESRGRFEKWFHRLQTANRPMPL